MRGDFHSQNHQGQGSRPNRRFRRRRSGNFDNNNCPIRRQNNFQSRPDVGRNNNNNNTNVSKTFVNRRQPIQYNPFYSNSNSSNNYKGSHDKPQLTNDRQVRSVVSSSGTDSLLVITENSSNFIPQDSWINKNNLTSTDKVFAPSNSGFTRLDLEKPQQQQEPVIIKFINKSSIEPTTKPSFNSIIQATIRLLMKHGAYNEHIDSNKTTFDNSDSSNLRKDAQIVISWQKRQETSPSTGSNTFVKNDIISIPRTRPVNVPPSTPITGQNEICNSSEPKISNNFGGRHSHPSRIVKRGKNEVLRRRTQSPIRHINRSSDELRSQSSSTNHSEKRGKESNLDSIIRKCTGKVKSPFTTWEIFNIYSNLTESGIRVPMHEMDPL